MGQQLSEKEREEQEYYETRRELGTLRNLEIAEFLKTARPFSGDNDELMEECRIDNENLRTLFYIFWEYVKEKEGLQDINDKNLNPEQKEIILRSMFGLLKTKCRETFNYIMEHYKRDTINWIDRWRSERIIRERDIPKCQGLHKFKKMIAHEAGIDPDLVIPTSRSILKDQTDDTNYGVGYFQIKVIDDNEIEDLMNKLTIKDTDVDELVENFQNRFSIRDRNRAEDLLKNKTPSQIKTAVEDSKLRATRFIPGRSYEVRASGSSRNPDYINIVEPYKEPYFDFYSYEYEYWVPQIYIKQGLPVLHQVKEVQLMKVKNGIYMKLQKVKGKDIYYFRKFIDFDDYLFVWQETYVKKFVELTKEFSECVKTLKNRVNLVKLARIIPLRAYYFKRIQDIRKYFSKDPENEKLKFYANNKVVSKLKEPVYEESLAERLQKINSKEANSVLEELSKVDPKKFSGPSRGKRGHD